MFSSINFLFLTALGITTWIILCYIKQLEEQRIEDIKISPPMGDTQLFEDVKIPLVETVKTASYQKYDLFLNFICIFVCIYALAKITQTIEYFVVKRIQLKFERNSISAAENLPSPDPVTIEGYRVQRDNLVKQILTLQKRNSVLESKLQEFLASTEITAGKENENPEKSSIGQQNVYISNRHIHMNRQVFVDEHNVKLKLQESQQQVANDKYSNIWQSFMEKQNCTASTSNQCTRAAIEHLNGMPLPVISTEELQKFHGLF